MATLIAILIFACFCIIAIPLALPLYLLIGAYERKQQEKIREEIYRGSFIYYQDFEKRWLSVTGTGKYGNRDGFKYQDGPGCYIITVYSNRVTDGNWKNYENVYVGQSKQVCQRVHNHFNGKGNGDVYADVKYGKWVYVSFVRCEEYEMNDKEIELISVFNAKKSYNKTRGGSAIR